MDSLLFVVGLIVGIVCAIVLYNRSKTDGVGRPGMWALWFFAGLFAWIGLIVYSSHSKPKALRERGPAQPFGEYGMQQSTPAPGVPGSQTAGDGLSTAQAPPLTRTVEHVEPQADQGAQAATKVCPHCGERGLPLDAVFCGGCGKPLAV